MRLLGIENIGIIDAKVVNLYEVRFAERIKFSPGQKDTMDNSINMSKEDEGKITN